MKKDYIKPEVNITEVEVENIICDSFHKYDTMGDRDQFSKGTTWDDDEDF